MYAVVVGKKAKKQLARLPKKDQRRINQSLIYLKHDPFSGKKLRGNHRDEYVLRVWPYLIIYTIEKKTVTVFVLTIAHRQGVY